MKKTLKIAMMMFVGLSLLMTGCTKDEEEKTPDNSSEVTSHLVGRWECTYSDNFWDGEHHYDTFVGEIWEFTTTGKMIMQDDDGTETLDFTVNGNNIIAKDYLGQVIATLKIVLLTGNTLELHWVSPEDASWYQEYTLTKIV